MVNTNKNTKVHNKHRVKNASVATHLPVVTVCNMRSFFPKVEYFKLDFFENQVEASLLCEVWHKIEDKRHKLEIEKMLKMDFFVLAIKYGRMNLFRNRFHR